MGSVQIDLGVAKLAAAIMIVAFPVCLIMFAFSSCSLRKRSEKAACHKGDVNECMYVGKYYEDKLGGRIAIVMSYADDSIAYYFEACKLKSSRGCERMLYLLAHSEQVKNLSTDEAAIADALIADCAERAPDTCEQLWSFMEDTDWAQNRSALAFDKRCLEGNAYACYQIGRMSEQGIGQQRNMPEVVLPLYDKACENGVQDSCTAARNYRDGHSPPARGSAAMGSAGSGG
jgi:TPR repeat protein